MHGGGPRTEDCPRLEGYGALLQVLLGLCSLIFWRTNPRTRFLHFFAQDLEQLGNHLKWIHKVHLHPRLLQSRPPLNCQKCQYRFFTDQGLERHLLGAHGLVTSSMQDAANNNQDAGRCPICGKVDIPASLP